MADWQARLKSLKQKSTCRITTRGRRTGKPHTVTIWFAAGENGRVYLGTLKLGRDWPKNVAANPEVVLEIGDLRLEGRATRLTEAPEVERVDSLMRNKYWLVWLVSWFGLRSGGAFEVQVSGEA